jgi:DNA-binding NarL/FixJ family response regulator
MRILIADDHEAIRKCVRTILQLQSRADIDVCAEATNGKEAVERARELKPDLILMDINMPVVSGLDAAKEIKQHLPGVPILFFSLYDSPDVMEQARSTGDGVVLQDQMGVTLLKAVDALLRGETFFSS